jgi:hypothetical protein
MTINPSLDGGPDRDQTDDLVVANDALYQLSYRPVREGEVLEKAGAQVNTNFQHRSVHRVTRAQA